MGQLPPGEPAQTQRDQTRELLTFLRDENAANRSALSDDAERNRRLLTDSLKLISYPLAVLLAIAGFFGFKSITDLKQTLETEARQSTRSEINRMQEEIRTRLKDQFQTPALQKMVKDEAQNATKQAADPLIKSEVRSEVASQVRLRVDAERPSIAAAVTRETGAAVKAMSPQIGSLVKQSVDEKVATDVQPLIERVKDEADLQGLISRMNADDAEAFDSLFAAHSYPNPTQEKMVRSAVKNTILAHNQGFYSTRGFPGPLTDEQLIADLSNSESTIRQAALDTLLPKAKTSMLPKVVEMIRSDASLDVRCSAHRLFNALTKQQFQNLDKASVLNWWEANKQSFESAK